MGIAIQCLRGITGYILSSRRACHQGGVHRTISRRLVGTADIPSRRAVALFHDGTGQGRRLGVRDEKGYHRVFGGRQAKQGEGNHGFHGESVVEMINAFAEADDSRDYIDATQRWILVHPPAIIANNSNNNQIIIRAIPKFIYDFSPIMRDVSQD